MSRSQPVFSGPWLALLVVICGTIILRDRLTYSPDSWALYELSRTVFGGDFYAVRHIRSFEQVGPYSSAFPPLWPVLIAVTDALTGLGARSGFVLAVLSSLLFAIASEIYGRRLFSLRWIGLTAAALIFVSPGFGEELLAGRTIPLQLALYATALAVAAKGQLQGRHGLLLGLLLGLALLNRFDALPVAILLPVAALLLRPNFRFYASYASALLVTISPWIFYSRFRFGSVFKSDNGSIALSVEPRHVAEFHASAPVTASDEPIAWLMKVAGNGIVMVGHFLASLNALTWVAALSVLAILLWQGASRVRVIAGDQPTSAIPPRRVLIFGPLLMALTLCGYVVTGYFDARYFTPLWWMLILMLLAACVLRLPEGRRESASAMAAYVAMIFALLFGVVLPARSLPSNPQFPARAADAGLKQCLTGREDELILMRDHAEAARLSALYGMRTLLMPLNFDRLQGDELAVFLRRYPVRIVVPGEGAEVSPTLPADGVAPMRGCPSGWFQQMVNSSIVPRQNEASSEPSAVAP